MIAGGVGSLPFRRVAVLGPGLIGGSVALALQRAGTASVVVWSAQADELLAARMAGFATEESLVALARRADLFVLCVPVGAMLPVSGELVPHLAPEATVTDVGSVKAPLERELRPLLGDRFVGAHPIAGSERSGFGAARADLFEDARCFVVPSPDAARTTAVERFWGALGCRPSRIGAEEHDAIVARTSHLAHATAALLLHAIERDRPNALEFAGPGLRDTSRLASSDAVLWTGILMANRDEVRAALSSLAFETGRLQELLKPGREAELGEYLELARDARKRIPG